VSEYRSIVGQEWVVGANERFNELEGLIQFAEGNPQMAVRRLLLAGRKNPRIMYLTALAFREVDQRKSSEICRSIVSFNEPHLELAYVRSKARRLLADL
jgi:hypothetical protein